ncbi:MarR family transcriptional regulator [Jatrophihabitans sp. GAS493]|uniref:MarR family winged helix-turn-helix transcriptional regulator n=1 Tax=Jatrophihabitans sp. GAS493 TaxID=1907575 RepID=UPI000BB8699E|nr:MarR family transcriptional regulator [Jatrophihabitans sp. GAS493]SOD70426.1 MarR family transcriptional regulator [Jatrophihabitans sp. GAS493]
MTTATTTAAELAALLRPSILRLTRVIRNQRVDLSVTLTQLSALGTLNTRGPMGAGELAGHERVQPPSMTKILGALEEHGLVSRVANPNDKRQAIIAITDDGIALLAAERESRNEWLSQRLAALTPEERAALQAIVPVFDKLAQL